MSGGFTLSAWAIDLTPLRVNRQFRLLFIGRLVSMFALGMLMVVLSVQIYDLTGSSLQVALVNTALGVSTFVGALAGGVLADRVDRRRVILVSRALAIAGLVGLACNASLDEPSVAALYVFAVWDGVTGSIGSTAFGAAVPAVVPRAMLPATGTLMAMCLDLGSAASPLVGGVLAGAGGFALVYWVVAVISVISWLFLFQLRPIRPGASEEAQGGEAAEPAPGAAETEPGPSSVLPGESSGELSGSGSGWRGWRADLVGGLRFASREPVVAAVLLMGFLQIFFASPHVLIPEFVQSTLGGGPEAVGLMYSATSVGAIIATLASGWVPRVRRVGLVIVGVYVSSSMWVVAFGLSPTVAIAAVAMALVGAGDVIGEILRFTVLAERTPDRLRGRVQSLWAAQATVGDSLGGPVLSVGARLIGVGPVIVVGGLVAAVTTALLLLTHPRLRTLTRTPDTGAADTEADSQTEVDTQTDAGTQTNAGTQADAEPGRDPEADLAHKPAHNPAHKPTRSTP
ncbi:ENTS family enterobactin (siderophore) exporter [Kineosphaera limosa]|uniref:Multidrug efflux pump Tap n=1 Tax=Kineosphaera limosa NBRC 100340 TaxID=1184609 RepID=K6WMC0_9MICO|nr:MFS transporter [Kineosphaera limosa]NYE00869.1 ENTS family enterobactin (siderophore) exporter [Kineosphaera limosa]GAB94936.1 putative siderophore export protein [Kineosphaera limosa NBRC 100340]